VTSQIKKRSNMFVHKIHETQLVFMRGSHGLFRICRVDLKQGGEKVSFVEKCLVTWSEFGYSYVDGKLLDVME